MTLAHPAGRQQPQTRYPIPFDIDFDPQQVDSRRTYVLTASIVNGSRTIYTMQQAGPGPGSRLAPQQVNLSSSTG